MGTHRTYEHLQECYMVGGIHRINGRIDDLRKAGLEFLDNPYEGISSSRMPRPVLKACLASATRRRNSG